MVIIIIRERARDNQQGIILGGFSKYAITFIDRFLDQVGADPSRSPPVRRRTMGSAQCQSEPMSRQPHSRMRAGTDQIQAMWYNTIILGSLTLMLQNFWESLVSLLNRGLVNNNTWFSFTKWFLYCQDLTYWRGLFPRRWGWRRGRFHLRDYSKSLFSLFCRTQSCMHISYFTHGYILLRNLFLF